MWFKTGGCTVAMAVFAAVGVVSAAAPERPLPSFSVQAVAGAPLVASADLSSEPRWLLVYVTPSCEPCRRLLRELRQWQSPALRARTIILVGEPVEEGARFVADSTEAMPGLQWYLDPARQAFEALGLDTAPALVGVERGTMKWTISGVLNDPKVLEPVVRAWVEPPP